MSQKINRREFVIKSTAAGLAAAAPRTMFGRGPTMITPQSVKPVVIASGNGLRSKDGDSTTCVERAFKMITEGEDVLDSLIAGVNIVELDPMGGGVGYGGMPNAEGVVQLDACCMHGPKKLAGGVGAIEGVKTPSLVAQAVMDYTDHHLLVGQGAQDFARNMGFEIHDDLNTENSRRRWMEWRRRTDPNHYLDPKKRSEAGYEAALTMLADGLIDEDDFWGTINCDGINPKGEVCGVTTTSGLAWKIPSRVGDSPILGAGLYVDGEVGAAGSTGRGEANLYNLTSFLIVENMRRGMHPKDAGMEGLKRIKANTIEKRLLKDNGDPAFGISFYILNAKGEYAGVSMYATERSKYAVCTEEGGELVPLEPLLEGTATE
jgi:N4-(beta-N-acetylglucosaminyl)-L-asparaginase